MSIQKKSLISTLKTTKKANVVSGTPKDVLSPETQGSIKGSLRGTLKSSQRGTLKGTLKSSQKTSLKK